MIFFYRIGIALYLFVIWLLQLFNKKAKQWIDGRKKIKEKFKTLAFQGDVVWFHVSSLGEFEQGRPIVERIKTDFPTIKVVLTFFSPSGYEIRKNYSYADAVFYLPIDTPSNARLVYDCINPKLVVFVKYDFWYFYIREANRRNIPIILVSSVFKPNQIFFKWYGQFFRRLLRYFSFIFVQDEQSAELLKKIEIKSEVTGDTRCDRVIQIAQKPLVLNDIRNFIGERFTIVCGSLWNEDLQILKEIINTSNKKVVWIIAPHNIDEDYLCVLEKQIKLPQIRYSFLTNHKQTEAQVLIIDNIGMLASIYQFAKIAYIGGGFGKGIHNILEPAVFGVPVIFGPKYHKFNEATEMIASKAAFSISNVREAMNVFNLLIMNDAERKQIAHNAYEYIQKKSGATEKILAKIKFLLS